MWRVVEQQAWAACLDRQSSIEGALALAIDVTPDRAWSTIAVAGHRDDGLEHVEIVDHRPGTDWLLERCRDLDERWSPQALAIDPAGPIGSKAAELETLFGERLIKVTMREHAAAAGDFVDAVTYGTLRHRGTSELDAALACATKRPLGDAFAFTRAGTSPVSPLVAVTLARLALHRAPPPETSSGPLFAFS